MGADPRDVLLLLVDAPYPLEPLQTCNHKWFKIFPQTMRLNCTHLLNEKQTNLTVSFFTPSPWDLVRWGDMRYEKNWTGQKTGLNKKLDWTKNKQI